MILLRVFDPGSTMCLQARVQKLVLEMPQRRFHVSTEVFRTIRDRITVRLDGPIVRLRFSIDHHLSTEVTR